MPDLTHVIALSLLAVLGGWLSIIDVREHRLPDKLTATLGALTLVVALTEALATGAVDPVLRTAGAACLVFVIMAALVVAGSGIGGGDLKFAAAANASVALVAGTPFALGGLALGLVLVGVAAAYARRAGRDVIPYGPGLWLGALIVGVVGAVAG